jgi:hypothetical protein
MSRAHCTTRFSILLSDPRSGIVMRDRPASPHVWMAPGGAARAPRFIGNQRGFGRQFFANAMMTRSPVKRKASPRRRKAAAKSLRYRSTTMIRRPPEPSPSPLRRICSTISCALATAWPTICRQARQHQSSSIPSASSARTARALIARPRSVPGPSGVVRK